MSLYVLMRILETAPDRYELAIRMLTYGRVDRSYDRLASQVRKGQRVLDLGCGTGDLTLRAARRGARVTGIDINARMLETAARRAREAGLADHIVFRELGVAELEGEKAKSYDAILCGLCFSELTEGELILALGQVKRLLKPGGLLLVADEVKPKSRLKR